MWVPLRSVWALLRPVGPLVLEFLGPLACESFCVPFGRFCIMLAPWCCVSFVLWRVGPLAFHLGAFASCWSHGVAFPRSSGVWVPLRSVWSLLDYLGLLVLLLFGPLACGFFRVPCGCFCIFLVPWCCVSLIFWYVGPLALRMGAFAYFLVPF